MLSLRVLSLVGLCASLVGAVPAAPALAGIQDRRGVYEPPPPNYGGPTTTRPDGPGCKPPKPTSTDNCSTRTLCADYVNECGMMYGGCFSDCKPYPSFTAPPCPTSSTSAPVPTTTDNCSTRTICADYVNECGMAYGGCFSDCKPYPSFTAPPCPTGSTSTPVPTSADNCSTRTVCADYINECGMMYGGCFPDCKPWPSFTAPPCPSGGSSTPPYPVPTTSTDNGCDRTVCVDYVNECGMAYGGCHPDCAPYPTYTPPPCYY
ncbi:hypothetical protein F5X68DRAFT_262593 [Plectosphaerella plurivora]|uniref:Uncharacterized protein n=1 Tax=Plectosphaerella plurivora TaxID=936078 RepID=A0A9P9A9P1_9PEZI|nr:hypothetical protein F5X68DRAFT_262593 [Plectosphaerella plurivora]